MFWSQLRTDEGSVEVKICLPVKLVSAVKPSKDASVLFPVVTLSPIVFEAAETGRAVAAVSSAVCSAPASGNVIVIGNVASLGVAGVSWYVVAVEITAVVCALELSGIVFMA